MAMRRRLSWARRPRAIRAVVVEAALAVGMLAVAGCAAGVADPGSDGPTPGATPTVEIAVEAGWLDGGRQLGLVTWGSSTCVPTASEVAPQADGTLAVTLAESSRDACTADFAPRVTLVEVPAEVDPAKDLAIVVTDAHGSWGETSLDGVPGLSSGGGSDVAPSAAWVDDDLFAVLTWGSPCATPVVGDVTASGGGVTVTFLDPPSGPTCTANLAARVTLVDVAELDIDEDGATATLTGGDLPSPVTVPIVG